MKKSNIILIGMPGAGKSTIGVILAKKISKSFVDTDIVIQERQSEPLYITLEREGYMGLRRVEEEVLLTLNLSNHVIATGGSAAYSDKAMRHLGINGVIVFLDLKFETIKSRIKDFETRGIAKRPDQSFEELFDERFKLYKKYSNIQVDCNGLNQEDLSNLIISKL